MIIKKFYENNIKSKFFNKLLLIYTMVIMLTLFSLAYIISNNISEILIQNEIKYSTFILNETSNYFEDKYKATEMILTQIYLDSFNSKTISTFLKRGYTQLSVDYINEKLNFDRNIEPLFAYDSSISSITVLKNKDDQLYIYSPDNYYNSGTFSRDEYTYPERINSILKSDSKIQVLPLFSPIYNRNVGFKAFTMGFKIKDAITMGTLGTFLVDFSANTITKDLSIRNLGSGTDIIAITAKGDILYDMSNIIFDNELPIIKNLIKAKDNDTIKIGGVTYIVNIKYIANLDVYIVGLITRNSTLKASETVKNTTFIVAVFCFLFSMMLVLFSTANFNRRIKGIIFVIKKLRKGDFSGKILIGKTTDELTEVAVCINKMCDELKEFIDRIYLLEIKQKNAELTALQAQMDPHFLYNTLEAIRMKAIINDDRDVGNMILILSKFLRRSIKGDKIILIKDEIEYLKMYLEIFKIRMGNIITVEYDIHDDILFYGVIRLVLQPLVENYIKYGFDNDLKQNCIFIKVFKEEDHIVFIVQDNGKGMSYQKLAQLKKKLASFDLSNTANIGLTNLNERIKLIYGNECGVDIQSEEGKGTIVTTTIKANTREELIDLVQSSIS